VDQKARSSSRVVAVVSAVVCIGALSPAQPAAATTLSFGQEFTLVDTPALNALWIGSGDFNRDGRMDVVCSLAPRPGIAVFLAGSDGLDAYTEYEVGNEPHEVLVGDVDADGNDDVLTGNVGSNTVSVRYGAVDGSFPERRDFFSGPSPGAMALGRINADPWPDLILVSPGQLRIMRGTSDGGFESASVLATPDPYGRPFLVHLNDDAFLIWSSVPRRRAVGTRERVGTFEFGGLWAGTRAGTYCWLWAT
jgi:hypothetical protein